MKEQKYIPISCNFYDELEALATLKKSCAIEYKDEKGENKSVEAVIIDFFIQDKVEYLLLDNDQSIRLDQLISANGKQLTSYC